jgi:hypothetical protein
VENGTIAVRKQGEVTEGMKIEEFVVLLTQRLKKKLRYNAP